MRKFFAKLFAGTINAVLLALLTVFGAAVITFLAMICVVTVGVVFSLFLPYIAIAAITLLSSIAVITVMNIWYSFQLKKAVTGLTKDLVEPKTKASPEESE